MKHIFLSVLLLITFFSYSQTVDSFFHNADGFFKKHVSNESVSYASVKKNSSEVDALSRQVGSMNLSKENEATKKTFYINAYNIIVIYEVTKHYPLKSPMDIPGFFDKVKHKVAGQELTLNELEKNKLLSPYKDPRIHFALVCAARSCPPLPNFAFTPDQLDKQLTERTTQALNNPNWLKVQPGKKKVELSKIFEWYNKDFTSGGKSLMEWINHYRKEKIPTSYSISYYEYDWALNDMPIK